MAIKAIYDVAAPAKLNLFLHVVGRRTDGYHLIQSVFMLIDWFDTLHFELRPRGEISREDLTQPLPTDDLIVRAAKALQVATGTTLGVHIAVEKSIPTQAGMGGGSSDAASSLLALNRLWKLNLSLEQLTQIGLKLGADVPFFLSGRNAWVQGVGDLLAPVDLPHARFLVAKPATGLDTARVFSAPGLVRNTDTAILKSFANNPFGFGQNDLQAVAQELCPEIETVLAKFHEAGFAARMTGSGSAMFAHVPGGVPGDVPDDVPGGVPDDLSGHVSDNAAADLPSDIFGAIGGEPMQGLKALQTWCQAQGVATKLCKNLMAHPQQHWAS